MPIRLQLLFFGATADIVGGHRRSFEVVGETTVTQLIDSIVIDYPDLRRHKLLFSVNQEYVSDDVTLNEDDEVGLFTAVSGG